MHRSRNNGTHWDLCGRPHGLLTVLGGDPLSFERHQWCVRAERYRRQTPPLRKPFDRIP
jgi:hypothetical protein